LVLGILHYSVDGAPDEFNIEDMVGRIPRFRDVWTRGSAEGDPQLCLLTRGTGGLEENEPKVEWLRNHPLYVEDFLHEEGESYVSFVFRLPKDGEGKFKTKGMGEEQKVSIGEVREAVIRVTENGDPYAKFIKLIADMAENKDTPEVKRAVEATKPLMEEIEKVLLDIPTDGKSPIVKVIKT